MEYILLPQLEIPVSCMIYGTAFSKMMEGHSVDDVLDYVSEQGVTTFDTARSYGLSERVLGDWIQRRGNRGKINVLTKGCNPDMTKLKFTPKSLRSELEESLSELQTNYVDLYALHRDDTSLDVSVFVETLNEFAAEGKIKAFGASNWHYTRMDAANEYAYAHNLQGFSFGSPAFSLAEVVGDPWGGSIAISGEKNADARKWFEKNQIPVFNYSAFGRGFMSGKYRTDMKQDITEVLPSWTCEEYVCEANMERLRRAEQLADKKNATVSQINLAWIMQQPFVCCPVFSPSSVGHIEENLKGLNVRLTEEEIAWLELKG
ncbi:MAG: aldo/keto reductase [Lachnospiraceae bacterium]|nr:aldo/keto reductase [Lachnospiraceae bacterium]